MRPSLLRGDRFREPTAVAEPKDSTILSNRPAQAMFGRSYEDELAASLGVIIPARSRDRHWRHRLQVSAGREFQYAGRAFSGPQRRAPGIRISIEFTVAPLRDEAAGLDAGGHRRDVSRPGVAAGRSAGRLTESEADLANLRR
jgi:hypothetical protein